jgi:hypothetical protein
MLAFIRKKWHRRPAVLLLTFGGAALLVLLAAVQRYEPSGEQATPIQQEARLGPNVAMSAAVARQKSLVGGLSKRDNAPASALPRSEDTESQHTDVTAQRTGGRADLSLSANAPGGPKTNVEPTSVAQSRPLTVDVQGIRVPIEPGKKYKILYMRGSTEPRPLTPAEQSTWGELHERIEELRRSKALTAATLAEIAEQLNALSDINQPRRMRDRTVWIPLYAGQNEPPDSEAIVIDLRNR